MALVDDYNRSTNPAFAGILGVLAVRYAMDVFNEDPATINHAKRVALAAKMRDNPLLPALARVIAVVPCVRAVAPTKTEIVRVSSAAVAYDGAPEYSTDYTPDEATILKALAEAWNFLAE